MGILKRGDVVTIAGGGGDYGSKPRPAIVIQANTFDALDSVVVLPLTGHLEDAAIFRIIIEPSRQNGITRLSQVMIDKIMPVRKDRINDVIGEIDRKLMKKMEVAIAVFLGIA